MIQFSGLCSSCINASNCTYPRSASRPVAQCAEFQGFPNRKKDNSIKNISKSNNPGIHCKKENPNINLGLCRNCEIRNTCKFPKPEGGIWHCEEYR